MFQQLPIAPGIVKEITEVAGEGRWTDGNNCRFVGGRPEKIGGWESLGITLGSTPRSMIAWQDLAGRSLIGIGTEAFLFLLYGNTAYNITPVDSTPSVNFSFTASDATITVTHTSHGRQAGDYIYFDGSVSFSNSTTLFGYLKVTVVNSANEYQVEMAAQSPDTKTETAVSVGYLVRTIEETTLTGAVNYGAGNYGTGDYASVSVTAGYDRTNFSLWSLDAWGEDLIATLSNGNVYQWDASGWNGVSQPSRATTITNAPATNSLGIVLTAQRHLVMFGTIPEGGTAFDPLQIRWCDREQLTDWTSTAQNRAGGLRIPGGVEIVGAVETDTELLVLTDNEAWAMEYIGGGAVFSLSKRGTHCGLIGRNAAVNVGGVSFWMSQNNFFIYNGTPQVLPCSVHDFVFDNLDRAMVQKVYAAYLAEHDEVWWFYQDTNSPAGDNNRCVVYSLSEQAWWIGDVPRTVMLDRGALFEPIAFRADGVLFKHETGNDDDTSPMEAHVTSGLIDISDGEQFMVVQRALPDFRNLSGSVNITYGFSRWSEQTPVAVGPFVVNADHAQHRLRGRGRFMQLTVQSESLGSSWHLGAPRFDITPSGRK
jgi:hypothetical protein